MSLQYLHVFVRNVPGGLFNFVALQLPEGAPVACGSCTPETAVRRVIIAFLAVEAAGRLLFLFHAQLYGQYKIADRRDDDAQVHIHDRGIAADMLIDYRLDARNVLGDEKQAKVLFSGYNEAVEEARARLELSQDIDRVLGRDIDLGELQADLHQVHACDCGNDPGLLELSYAGAYGRLREPHVLCYLDLRDVGVLFE